MKKILIPICVLALALLLLGLFFIQKLPKGDRVPFESGRAYAISWRMTLFAKQHNGIWPTNWAQLTNLTELNRDLVSTKDDLVQEVFAFLPTNPPLADYDNGRLVVIQRKPTKSSGSLGRYFVYYDPTYDEFNGGSMPENEVQVLFSNYNVMLPPPDPAEVRAAQEAVEKAEAEEKAMRAN